MVLKSPNRQPIAECESSQEAKLQVFRSKACAFCDAGEHLWADLFAIVERPCETVIALADELYVRAFADASVFYPADPEKGAKYFLRFRAWPVTQAAAN